MKAIRAIFFILGIIVLSNDLWAQELQVAQVDTEKLVTEVEGTLDLLWMKDKSRYRYFVRKDDKLVELINTDIDGPEKKEFRRQLRQLIPGVPLVTADVKFLLYSLRHFINKYNSLVVDGYVFNKKTPNISMRIGLFAGVSNNIYSDNPGNVRTPAVELEFEFYDAHLAPRHVALLNLRQDFKKDQKNNSDTQLGLNYRFKFLNPHNLSLYVDLKLAAVVYSDRPEVTENNHGNVGFSFTTPLSFGIGGDFKLSKRSFIGWNYNDFFSLILDANNNFPIDFMIGYKYKIR